MRKLLIITVLSFVCANLPSTGYKSLFVLRAERINPYEKLWTAICKIESNNNPLAYCIDVNGKPSIGVAQIQESKLIDFNKATGKRYNHSDCFNPVISREIFMHFASGNYKRCAKAWNGKGKLTEVYWEKLIKFLYN
jgi:hypothetical protein